LLKCTVPSTLSIFTDAYTNGSKAHTVHLGKGIKRRRDNRYKQYQRIEQIEVAYFQKQGIQLFVKTVQVRQAKKH
jgi:hypothetical protein